MIFISFFTVLFYLFNISVLVSAADSFVEDFSHRGFTSPKYDKDFQNSYRNGQVKSLMDYLEKLSEYVSTDSDKDRKRKTKAILYFFATGGEMGFRKTPATLKETEKLTNILRVTTALDYEDNEAEFDLLQIRQKYGRPSYGQITDEEIKNHILIAQSIISSVVITQSFIENYGDLNTSFETVQQQVHESFKKVCQFERTFSAQTKEFFLLNLKNQLSIDTVKVIIECMKKKRMYNLPYTIQEIQIDFLTGWIDEFCKEYKEEGFAVRAVSLETPKPTTVIPLVSVPYIQSPPPTVPIESDKRTFEELEKLLSEFNQANSILSQLEKIYQLTQEEALRQMIELNNKGNEQAKEWIENYGKHYKEKYPDLFEEPTRIPERNSHSIALNPDKLKFEAVSVNFSYNAVQHARFPYFTRSKEIFGREAFKGKIEGKDITLLSYQTLGGGICGFAALFQAIKQNQGNTNFVPLPLLEGEETHPLYEFIENLGEHLNIFPKKAMLTQNADINPFVDSDTFQKLEEPLRIRAYIWLKEEKGIMLNSSPGNTDVNAKPVHILLSNNHGKADGHFSLLVPSDDDLLIEQAKFHEEFARNAGKFYENAQVGKLF